MSELFPFDEALRGLNRLREQKDDAYRVHGQVVALLARMAYHHGWPVGLARHPAEDTAWDADWRTIVFIDLPTGQASWHLHDSEVVLFGGLPEYPRPWDGHSTPEKYRRVNSAMALAVCE